MDDIVNYLASNLSPTTINNLYWLSVSATLTCFALAFLLTMERYVGRHKAEKQERCKEGRLAGKI